MELGESHVFGEEEVILKRKRLYKVTCTTAEGELYRMTAETYIKKLYEPVFLNNYFSSTQVFSTKNAFLNQKLKMNNQVAQADIRNLEEAVTQGRELYFQRQVEEALNNVKTKGTQQNQEEARVSKFLIKKFSLKMYENKKAQQFHHIDKCLQEVEHEFSQEQFRPSTHAEYLQRVGKIYIINKMKKMNQTKAKMMNENQILMGNLGLGLRSSKSSKAHYFNGQGQTQQNHRSTSV